MNTTLTAELDTQSQYLFARNSDSLVCSVKSYNPYLSVVVQWQLNDSLLCAEWFIVTEASLLVASGLFFLLLEYRSLEPDFVMNPHGSGEYHNN